MIWLETTIVALLPKLALRLSTQLVFIKMVFVHSFDIANTNSINSLAVIQQTSIALLLSIRSAFGGKAVQL